MPDASNPDDSCLTPYVDLALVVLAALLTGLAYVRRGYFELDDYRFLAHVQRVEAREPGALARALTIENRWDGSWWVEDGTFVRFFRPFHVASYALDRAVFGLDARGFVATNVALHAGASALVWLLLRRLVGGRAPPLIGAAAFAAHACHAEPLHFIAGRQETMAALAFLGALLAHARARPGARGAAAVAGLFFLALLSKEWALILLPALVLHDVSSERGDGLRRSFRGALRERRATWIACCAVLAAYLALRHAALGEGGSGARPFPYFFLPGRESFGARTLAVAWQYACALAAGTPVRPFLSGTGELLERVSRPELAAGIAAPAAVLALACRQRAGRFFAALLLGALIPMLCLYSSGRYLYLPSVAWCGMLAVLWRDALPRGARAARIARTCGGALLLALAALPAARHGDVLRRLPTAGSERSTQPERLLALVRAASLPLKGPRPIFFADFPWFWIETQFLPDLLAVELGRDPVDIGVLAQLPFEPAPLLELRRVAPSTVELSRGGYPLHIGDPGQDFDQRDVRPGDRIAEARCSVRVIDARDGRATRVQVTFDRPLEELVLVRGVYDPADDSWALEEWTP